MQATVRREAVGREEGDLVEAWQRGDPTAMEILYDRHAPVLLGLAVRLLQDRSEAEDLVHDVFVEAWRNASSFDPSRGGLVTWLTVRLRSRGIDRLRRRGADPTRTADEGAIDATAPEPDHAPGLGREVDRRRARSAMEALPEEQRVVVELAYFSGLTFREIAQRLSVPVSTAKSRMVAAIRILRTRLAAPREVA